MATSNPSTRQPSQTNADSLRAGRAILTLVCLVALTSYTGAQAPPATNYVVGPQDVLTITSFDQDDLSGKYQVDADGTFSFPLVGRVHAGGRTLREVQAEIVKLLKDGFFKDPQIGIAVEQYRSQKVHIVGEVRTPGTYSLTGDMSLIEALARAGSATQSASGEIMIVRG